MKNLIVGLIGFLCAALVLSSFAAPNAAIPSSGTESYGTIPDGVISYSRDCTGKGYAKNLHTHATIVASGVGTITTIVEDNGNAASSIAATQTWTTVIDTSIANNIDVTCTLRTE